MIKILVVDDSLERVRIISEAIASSKHAVIVDIDFCDTADRARRELKNHYDLLILDILIPKKVGGVPQASHSVSLLGEICSAEGRYVRPGLIIGLTADVSELNTYKEEFLRSASVVLDGSLQKRDWITSLLSQLDSLVGARRKVAKKDSKKLLMTVHGIRTYGKWQSSLQQETKAYSDEFEYIDIKYGYFDIISFCIPYFRSKKIASISNRVSQLIDDAPDKDIYLVAHSFGTMIVCEALNTRTSPSKIKRLIMCGSPLSHKYDLDKVVASSELTINDCGTKDAILVLARTLVLGLGDAGRTGFQREDSKSFLNRFHSGGHSLYFEESDSPSFPERYWLPLLISDTAPAHNDERVNFFGEDLFEISIKTLNRIKPWLYIGAATAIAYHLIKSWII